MRVRRYLNDEDLMAVNKNDRNVKFRMKTIEIATFKVNSEVKVTVRVKAAAEVDEQ